MMYTGLSMSFLFMQQPVKTQIILPFKPKKRAILGSIFTIFLTSITTVAYAQNTLSLSDVTEKIQQYQQPLVWEQQKQITQFDARQRNLWNNPTLTVQQTGLKSGQEQELEVTLSQPIDVFSVRKKAAYAATLQGQEVELNQKLYQAKQSLIILYFWSEISLLEQEVKLLDQQVVISQENLNAATLKYRAGSISQLDLDRIRMSDLENQAKSLQQRRTLTVLKQQFANAWGEKNSDYILSTQAGLAEDLPNSPSKIDQNLYERTMQLQNSKLLAQINYLKAKARPMPSVILGTTRLKSADQNSTDQQVRIGVEVPLNIFNREQFNQKIAQQKMQLLEQETLRYQKQNTFDEYALISEMNILVEQYQLLMTQQIPLLENIRHKMFIGFQSGKYAVTDVQLATTELKQRQYELLQMLRSIWQKSLQVKALRLGVDPEIILNKNALSQLNQSIWNQSLNLATGGEQ